MVPLLSHSLPIKLLLSLNLSKNLLSQSLFNKHLRSSLLNKLLHLNLSNKLHQSLRKRRPLSRKQRYPLSLSNKSPHSCIMITITVKLFTTRITNCTMN